VRTPYRLDLTATVLRRLSTNVVDVFDGTVYRRLIGDPAEPTLLAVTQPSADAVDVRLEGPAAAAHFDPEALDRLAAGARGVKPPRYPTLWESIVNAVVYQQVSIHAAGAILRRVIERYARAREVEGARLFPFPNARTLLDADPSELRDLGLSINKINALKAVAAAIVEETLDEAGLTLLSTPELLAGLVAHKGIGPWTAAVVALRGFGRLDVFPMNDSGAAASLRTLSGDPAIAAEPVIAALVPQQGMLYYHLLIGRLIARGDLVL